MKMKIAFSGIFTAFQPAPVGTKVLDEARFLDGLTAAIEKHNFSADRVPGQGFLELDPSLHGTVSAGDGLLPEQPKLEDFILAEHRGVVSAYLARKYAGSVEFLAAVVYTLDAYAQDPQVQERAAAEVEKMRDEGVSHVLVTVIASSGPEAPLTPHRFVENLAGGNREAEAWSADEIRAKARDISAYWQKYAVVAGA